LEEEANFVSGYEAHPLENDPNGILAVLSLAEVRKTEEGRGHALRVSLKSPYDDKTLLVTQEFRFEVKVRHPNEENAVTLATVEEENGGFSSGAVAAIVILIVIVLVFLLALLAAYWAWRNAKWCFKPKMPRNLPNEDSALPLNEPNERPIIRASPRPAET